jgi:hypothetical protein
MDNYMCDDAWAKYKFIDTDLGYGETIGPLIPLNNLDKFVGISINGVFLYTGTSEFGYDAYYPKAFGGKTTPKAVDADICLGSSEYSGIYHYYMFTPCMYDIPLKSVAKTCDKDELCKIDKV